jgi:hypothetical protein
MALELLGRSPTLSFANPAMGVDLIKRSGPVIEN